MRITDVLRNLGHPKYPGVMGIARRPPKTHLEPEHRPPDLARFENKWVGVLNGRVIADADTSSELASALKELGPEGREAVMQFVRPTVAGYVIGVG
jgi:hypothetical protein